MKFEEFAHEMWLQNCDERATWSQPVFTEKEYREKNGEFLEEAFLLEYVGNKVWSVEDSDYKTPTEK
jgi:hypothetical protein